MSRGRAERLQNIRDRGHEARIRTRVGRGPGRQAFRLVGEDEADAAQGLLIGCAGESLLGRETGEAVPFQRGDAEIVATEA